MDDFSLLRLQIEWGADEALDDAPVVRLRAPEPRVSPPLQRLAPGAVTPQGPGGGTSSGGPSSAGASPAAMSAAGSLQAGSPAERAVAIAGRAETLDALGAALSGFDGCPLRATATNTVLAVGDPNAPCLVIGDPPNDDDDRSGQPFSGAGGQLLDTMLASAGLDRSRLLLTPMLPWRPPGGRPANTTEVAVCLPFLHRLIALVQPRFLVIAGPQALRALVGTRPRVQDGLRIGSCRVAGMPTPLDAVVLPFPANALRGGAARKEAWAALRRIRRMIDA